MPAFALGMEGLVPEAIRKMENLRSKHDVELGVAMALLYFHGKAKIVDRYVRACTKHHVDNMMWVAVLFVITPEMLQSS